MGEMTSRHNQTCRESIAWQFTRETGLSGYRPRRLGGTASPEEGVRRRWGGGTEEVEGRHISEIQTSCAALRLRLTRRLENAPFPTSCHQPNKTSVTRTAEYSVETCEKQTFSENPHKRKHQNQDKNKVTRRWKEFEVSDAHSYNKHKIQPNYWPDEQKPSH